MEDKHTPMEAAEVLELPPKEKPRKNQPPDGYYGTAVPETKKKNYTALWICLCLIIVFIGSAMVLLNLLQLRIETVNGRLALTFGEKAVSREPPSSASEPVNLTPDASPAASGGEQTDKPDFSIAISNSNGETAYSAGELYAMTNPSVVCVLAQTYTSEYTGTGVVMTSDGYIITAENILDDATSVSVIFSDSSTSSAAVIGTDSSTGIAVIKVDTEQELTPAQFASPDDLSIGDAIISIGNPFGSQIRNVLSQGIVSAISTTATVNGTTMTLLKTTAEPDSNSCPIINARGQVVAITSDIGTQLTSDGNDPHLAISIISVKQTMEALVQSGYASANSWLGFDVDEIPKPYLGYYGYPGNLWISSIGNDTVASKLLRLWDVIIAVDSTPVGSIEEFNTALSQHSVGDMVQLTLYRSGRLYLATLPLTRR